MIHNPRLFDALAQIVQFVIKFQENNKVDKTNKIDLLALIDFVTDYPKSFDSLAQYDEPIPSEFLSFRLDSDLWNEMLKELRKWKNLDGLRGRECRAKLEELGRRATNSWA
jgi:nicotinic acid phosphoribosyltransferase